MTINQGVFHAPSTCKVGKNITYTLSQELRCQPSVITGFFQCYFQSVVHRSCNLQENHFNHSQLLMNSSPTTSRMKMFDHHNSILLLTYHIYTIMHPTLHASTPVATNPGIQAPTTPNCPTCTPASQSTSILEFHYGNTTQHRAVSCQNECLQELGIHQQKEPGHLDISNRAAQALMTSTMKELHKRRHTDSTARPKCLQEQEPDHCRRTSLSTWQL